MHFQGYQKIVRAETTVEERRNRILRVRCGEISSTGKPIKPERNKPKTRYGTKALNDFVIVGQTVSTFMRLPQICHDVPLHKRNNTTGKTERSSGVEAVLNLRNYADDIHLRRNHLGDMKHLLEDYKDVKTAAKHPVLHTRSIDVRMPQTAPLERSERPYRRWSDGGSTFSGTFSDSLQPFTQKLARSLNLSTRSLNIIKSDPCVTQSPEELLTEFKEFAKRRDLQPDDASLHSVRVLRTLGTPQNSSGPLVRRFLKKSTSRVAAKDNNQTQKRQRRKSSKQPFQKPKRRVMIMPSGDSSRTRNTSQDKLYNTGNTGTVSTFSFRRGTRMMPTNNSILRKYETDDKNKRRISVAISEAHTGPSTGEIQEIQDLPVIRKFLRMPKSRPKVVCFDYPGVDLTHMDVKRAIENVIPDAFDSGKVVSIQFENLNVKLATTGMDNRWLIELHDFSTRNKLIKNGLTIDKPDRNSITDMKIPVPKWAEDHITIEGDAKDAVEFILPPIHYPRTVPVKLNDVVSMEEYKLFLRRTAATEKLQNVALLCAGRGDKLLTTLI